MSFKKITTYFFKVVFNIFLGLIEFFTFYFVIAFIFSVIPYNNNHSVDSSTEIYVLSNGVHTDIVLPAISPLKDWTKEIKYENTLAADTSMKYIAFGWGDKGFYLNTPRWADLKFSTAFNAMFALSTTAMHVTYYKEMKLGEKCKKIRINTSTLKKLIAHIENSFKKTNRLPIHIKGHHYGNADAFYEANGTYSLFNTCNTWANTALKQSGIKCCFWTPFDKGILYQCGE